MYLKSSIFNVHFFLNLKQLKSDSLDKLPVCQRA